MARSQDVRVWSGAAPEKHAELDVSFIRFPWAVDETIKNGIVAGVNGVLARYEPGLRAENPRLKQINRAFWKCTVDIVGTASPVAWELIALAIIVVVFIGIIVYRVYIRPLREALQDVVKDIDDVIAEKHAALVNGDISEEYAQTLDEDLEETRRKADEAGKDPRYAWVDFIERVLELGKYIPWVVGGAVVIAVLNTVRTYAPRR